MATRTAFKVGEKVKLASGGPVMTVQFLPTASTGPRSGYNCQWFAGKGLSEGFFPFNSLEFVPDSPPEKS